MKCKDCNRFCRFPKEQDKGLCYEQIVSIVEDSNPCYTIIRNENDTCNFIFSQPNFGGSICKD